MNFLAPKSPTRNPTNVGRPDADLSTLSWGKPTFFTLTLALRGLFIGVKSAPWREELNPCLTKRFSL